MSHIGFISGRKNLTAKQLDKVNSYLKSPSVTTLHIGDGTGPDAAVISLADGLGLNIIIHPCSSNSFHKYPPHYEVRSTRSPKRRNEAIINASSQVIICMYRKVDPLHNMITSAIRYASKIPDKETVVIRGDGHLRILHNG